MKLSIIVPVYNEKDTVEELLKSVLAMPLFSVEKEILVVDDGSNDGTTSILKNLEKNVPLRFSVQLK